MDKRLNEKTAVVTGSNRRIGRAIAGRLSAEGARVVLSARDAALLDKAVAEIRESGGAAAAIGFDLRAADSSSRLVEFTTETFGPPDIVVNNAGANKRGDLCKLSEEDWPTASP